MKIVTRYIIKTFCLDFSMTMFAAAGVVFLFDMIDLLRLTSKIYAINSLTLLQIAALENYHTLQKILPLIVMLSTQKTYLELSRSSQIIGFHGIGISDIKLLVPAITVVAFFSILHVLIFNPVGSYCMAKYYKMQKDELNISHPILYPATSGIWFKHETDQGIFIVYAERSIPESEDGSGGEELKGVQVIVMTQRGEFLQIVRADRLIYKDSIWTAKNVKITDREGQVTCFADLPFQFKISFEELSHAVVLPEIVGLWKLPEFIRKMQKLGFQTLSYRVYFWSVMFSVIPSITMLFIGYAFIPNIYNKKRGVFQIVVFSLAIGFIIYFLNGILVMVFVQKIVNVVFGIALLYVFSLLCSLYIYTRYKKYASLMR